MTFDTQARPTPRADIKRPRWGTPIVGAAALMMGVSLTACIQHVEDPNGVDVLDSRRALAKLEPVVRAHLDAGREVWIEIDRGTL